MHVKPEILIVEDDPFYREFLLRALGQDYAIEQAESGTKALERIRRHRFDAVLCDLRLPGMSGKDLIRRIREWSDEEIILIVITGFEKDWPPVETTDAQVFFYLKKGEFGPRDLLKVLQNGLLLRKSRLERKQFAEQLRALNLELEKKVAERTRALMESEAKYRNLFEQSMVGVYLEQEGQIRLVNQKLCNLLGYESADLVGKPIAVFITPAPQEGHTIAASKPDGSSPALEEVLLKTRSGDRRFALHCAGPVRSQSVQAVQGCLLDITAWKLLEQQLLQHQKMESLGTLVSGFAHEFNNILTAIVPQAELLRMQASQVPAISRPTEILYTMTEKACGLTRQLLGMSRKASLEMKPLEVNARIHETLSFLSTSMGSGIQVHLDLDPGAGQIEADSNQIDQILMNLVLNSRDAMPQGGTLWISSGVCTSTTLEGKSRDPGERSFVEIVMEDTGHGIAQENVSRIFDPFFTTKEPGKGTGLGLSVVYSMVKRHGGEIFVKSQQGKGSTFRILFPRLGSHAPARGKAAARAGRILVADPNPDMRNLFRDVLCRMHYEVIPAGSGQEALDIYTLQKDDIDWVILDSGSESAAPHSPAHRMVNLNPRVKLIVTHSAAPAKGEVIPDFPQTAGTRIRHLHVSQGVENLSRSLERVLEQGCR